jgi:hypothetical protein
MAELTMLQMRQDMARKAKAKAKAQSQPFADRIKPEKPQDGRSRWRILPSWRGATDPTIDHTFSNHWIKDEAGKVVAVHACLEKTYGQQCPICDAISEGIRHITDDKGLAVLTEAKAVGVSFLMNALQIDGKAPGKVLLLQLTPTTRTQLMDLIDQYADDGFDICDMNDGFDIYITRTGTTMTTTKYAISVAPKSTVANNAVLKDLIDIDQWVKAQITPSRELTGLSFIDSIVVGGGLPAPKALTVDSFDEDDDEPFEDDVLDAEFEEIAQPKAVKAKAVPVEDQEIDDLLAGMDDFDLS